MSITDAVKKFIAGDGDFKVSLKFLNFRSTGNKKDKKKVEILKDATITGDVYVIQVTGDVDSSTNKQLSPLYQAFQNHELSFVAEPQKKLLSSVIDHEQDPHIRGLLAAFKPVLSQKDYQLLRSGLYLHYLRQNNSQEATKQWNQLVQNNSGRDINVVKLASAGYFQTYFRPLLKELKGRGKAAEFKETYNNIVEELPFAIFVASEMTVDALCDEVIKKAERNVRYSVVSDVITLHAIGENATKTVSEAVTALRQTKFPKIKVTKTPAKMTVLNAKVYYRVTKND